MQKETLIKTVARLMTPPKGILAIDESLNNCNSRFQKLNIPTTLEKRREYRELLITTPEIEKYISGYILFDETIGQLTKKGEKFTAILKQKGIEIGIKVDKGLKELSPDSLEKVTDGLDKLYERLSVYKKMGASFAKWRAVYKIGDNTPTEEAMKANAERLAEYAFICQENSIVPIVEPEVLIDGNHTIEKCYKVMAQNFDILFGELKGLNIFTPGVILKTSMVISGKDAVRQAPPEEVAKMTVKCLKEHVPENIGGIVFLSGGQSDIEATLNLNAMHNMGTLPWRLTFSYGRAIQNPALESWAKDPRDISKAQTLLLDAAKVNSLASVGKYK